MTLIRATSVPFDLSGDEILPYPEHPIDDYEQARILSQQSNTLARMLSYLKALPASPAAVNSALEGSFETILAGEGGEFVLEVGPTSIFARHKDLVYPGPSTPYSGDIRGGLLITGNGIAMGYNDKTTGNFIPAIAITNTGDINIRGTLTAGSIIATTARIGSISGITVATLQSNAQTGATHAGAINSNPHGTSMAQIAGDLDDIADGSSYFKTTLNQRTGAGRAFNSLDSSSEYIYSINTQKLIVSGSNPVNGLVVDSNGLRGYAGSTLRMNINTTGTVWFAGDISGATGTFSSNVITGGQVKATGSTSSTIGNYAVVGEPASSSVGGILGIAGGGSGAVGVRGHSPNGPGVYGDTANIAQVGVEAHHQASGYGLRVGGARGITRLKNTTGKLRVWDVVTNTLQGEFYYEFGI